MSIDCPVPPVPEEESESLDCGNLTNGNRIWVTVDRFLNKSLARRGRPAQPIIDGDPQAGFGYRHHGDTAKFGAIELTQQGE